MGWFVDRKELVSIVLTRRARTRLHYDKSINTTSCAQGLVLHLHPYWFECKGMFPTERIPTSLSRSEHHGIAVFTPRLILWGDGGVFSRWWLILTWFFSSRSLSVLLSAILYTHTSRYGQLVKPTVFGGHLHTWGHRRLLPGNGCSSSFTTSAKVGN